VEPLASSRAELLDAPTFTGVPLDEQIVPNLEKDMA
jgi:hypothetical protein